MPNCYDLVGTLANVSYPSENITDVIYRPRGSFIVVSAQNQGDHTHLREQIKTTFPNASRIVFVKTGTDEAEGQRKAAVLKRLNADSYTDNNANILATIRRILPSITLYKMNANGTKRVFK
jgi:hypothetical protein